VQGDLATARKKYCLGTPPRLLKQPLPFKISMEKPKSKKKQPPKLNKPIKLKNGKYEVWVKDRKGKTSKISFKCRTRKLLLPSR
jgi:hypothetical protein